MATLFLLQTAVDFDFVGWLANTFPQLVILGFVFRLWWNRSTQKLDAKDEQIEALRKEYTQQIEELNKYIREGDTDFIDLTKQLLEALTALRISDEQISGRIDALREILNRKQ